MNLSEAVNPPNVTHSIGILISVKLVALPGKDRFAPIQEQESAVEPPSTAVRVLRGLAALRLHGLFLLPSEDASLILKKALHSL